MFECGNCKDEIEICGLCDECHFAPCFRCGKGITEDDARDGNGCCRECFCGGGTDCVEFPKGMKVGDLKKVLDGFDDDALVVLSCDREGNTFSPAERIGSDEFRYEEGEQVNRDRGVKALFVWPRH